MAVRDIQSRTSTLCECANSTILVAEGLTCKKSGGDSHSRGECEIRRTIPSRSAWGEACSDAEATCRVCSAYGRPSLAHAGARQKSGGLL